MDTIESIGEHIADALDRYQWNSVWPIINGEGIITGIYDGDAIPEDAVMVDWIDGESVEVDGQHGFDAILES